MNATKQLVEPIILHAIPEISCAKIVTDISELYKNM